LIWAALLIAAAPPKQQHSLAWEMAHEHEPSGDNQHQPIGDPLMAKHHIEAVIKSGLRDPDSAKFEWPYGFTSGRYASHSSGSFEGTITCGTVNAKNGYGGYTGREPVAVVLWGTYVAEVDLGGADDESAEWIASECDKLGMPVP